MVTKDKISLAVADELDFLAKELGTHRRTVYNTIDNESDYELRKRLLIRFNRFYGDYGTFYDLTHAAEQAILVNSPVAMELTPIRREVGIELITKNMPDKFSKRIIVCFKIISRILFGVLF